jgi:tetratricopeptide (TPR) repeat protein
MPGHNQPKSKLEEYIELLSDINYRADEFTLRRIEREASALLNHPEHGLLARQLIAYVCSQMDRNDEALEHYRELARRGDSFVAFGNYALALSTVGQHDQALSVLRDAIERWPEAYDPHSKQSDPFLVGALARVMHAAGHAQSAMELMDCAYSSLDPDDAARHLDYALAAEKIFDWASASTLLARWYALSGKAEWPEGGARELLASRPDLWEGTAHEVIVDHFLAREREDSHTEIPEVEAEDADIAVDLYMAFKRSRTRAWEEREEDSRG